MSTPPPYDPSRCRFTPPGSNQPCGAEPLPGAAIVMTLRNDHGQTSELRLPLCAEHAAALKAAQDGGTPE
jgi:hypothetical protein